MAINLIAAKELSPRANACLLHPASASASAVMANVFDFFTPLRKNSASPTAPALPGSAFAFCIHSKRNRATDKPLGFAYAIVLSGARAVGEFEGREMRDIFVGQPDYPLENPDDL